MASCCGWIYIFLIINDLKHLFLYVFFFAISISSLGRYLSESLVLTFCWVVCFLIIVLWAFFPMFEYLIKYIFCKYFSGSVTYLFIFLTVSLIEEEILVLMKSIFSGFFSFMFNAFHVLKKSLYYLKSKTFFPAFF